VLRTIADSGPLIALFEPAERNHARVRSFIENYEGALLTTWPVLTEVGHMLGHAVDRQLAFLRWVERGGVEVTTPGAGAVALIRQLSEKSPRPADGHRRRVADRARTRKWRARHPDTRPGFRRLSSARSLPIQQRPGHDLT
jgi:hypothetical protein